MLTDTDLFKGNQRRWGERLRKFVYENLAGRSVPITDNNGKTQIIEFARERERVQKDGAKSNHIVLDKLAGTNADGIEVYETSIGRSIFSIL